MNPDLVSLVRVVPCSRSRIERPQPAKLEKLVQTLRQGPHCEIKELGFSQISPWGPLKSLKENDMIFEFWNAFSGLESCLGGRRTKLEAGGTSGKFEKQFVERQINKERE